MMQALPQLWRGAALLILALALPGCAGPGQRSLPASPIPATLEVLAAQHRVCGVAVAVIRARRLVAVDTASVCQPVRAIGADSTFQAASLSKPVFAYAVLQLVAEGKMSLDAPLASYLPQGYRHRHHPLEAAPSSLVTDPRLQAVTVRMALNHTSGLPNWASGPLQFGAAPGSKWDYSGEGYMLLQRAVEAVTGQALDQFMLTQVFAPLGMQHSSYTWHAGTAPPLVAGTKANGKPRKTLAMTAPLAAFSLHTSAADYGKFLAHVLNDEVALRQIIASPVPVDPALELSWGLGWGIARSADDVRIWHWGNNPGYRAFVMASVRSGDGLVMLTNSENGLKLAEPLAQQVLPGQHKLFQSPILGVDLISIACNALRICL